MPQDETATPRTITGDVGMNDTSDTDISRDDAPDERAEDGTRAVDAVDAVDTVDAAGDLDVGVSAEDGTAFPARRERGRTTAIPLRVALESGPPDLGAMADALSAAPETVALPAVPAEAGEQGLAPVLDRVEALTPVVEQAQPPVVIAGARRLRKAPRHPFIKRRERPLMVRLVTYGIITALVASALMVTLPLGKALGNSGLRGLNPLIPASGVVASSGGVRYFWYTARWGDSAQSLAQSFHVKLGGIYKLNHLQAGDELLIGRQYAIPLDPNYGASYQPPALLTVAAHYGNVRFGPNWWDSIAGNPPDKSVCAPNGGANLQGYQLQAPNWGARWVRGFIVYGTWVYHTGVDLAAPQGNVIHAAQAGQVIWAGYDATNGLGWSVKIDHCNHVSTVYGHMLRVLVHVGDYVEAGNPVGLEGSTGNSTGPHLHFMVEWNNLWVDPMLFYPSQNAIRNPQA